METDEAKRIQAVVETWKLVAYELASAAGITLAAIDSRVSRELKRRGVKVSS